MFTLLAILAALPRSWLRAAVLTLLAAWLALGAPSPALAADGEVLLSQSSASSGWPIRITARGRYKLIGTIAGFQMSAIMNLGTSANYVRVENMRLVKNSYSFTMVTSPQIEPGGKGIVIRNNQVVDGQHGGLACGSDCLVQGNVISGHRTGVTCESPCGVGGNMLSRNAETWSGSVYIVNPNAIGPAY